MSDAIKALAGNMVSRKREDVSPYILLLGAGASISSGCSGMVQIVDEVLQSRDTTQFEVWEREIESATSVEAEYGELKKEKIGQKKRDRFFEIWGRLDGESQYAILRQHLWEGKSPSNGYDDLAYLIKNGYFKMVLSTNLDNLLEKALRNKGWEAPDDFVVVVNGKDRPEEVREQLESSRPPFKFVKLHGTLESPGSYAFTPEEVNEFETAIKPPLSQIINQSLIVVGYSMQDRDIDVLFDEEGKEIHFVNPTTPEPESRIDIILKVRKLGDKIKDDDGTFDNFFQKLRSYVEEKTEETSGEASVTSIENFLRNIGYDRELEVPRSRFRSLPTLYVKPIQYGAICSKLEKEHVVFIIGEPHLGKTYTAFYLLWEYYQKGYEVLHIRHDRLVSLLHQHDSDMKKLLLDLFTSEKGLPRIIHFDDPFGETMERRTDIFAKGLDTFLDLARQYEQLRIIVTTRLNIFRESMGEVHDRTKVEELEKDIRVHTSYRRDILLDILHRYTRFYNPLWTTDEKIVKALDEQLPDLLPAPHNIEFFVRTSERLTSLEEVLRHVEKSKEMIKALGEWMASLPDHEQLFLIWLEICSTTGILFPDTPASKTDFESAYMETLAYMFKKKYIAGIHTNPLSRSKDKFDMILLESRDEETDSVNLDFVHPSYHEAFWYAIQRKLPLHKWWELLKENMGEILKDFENQVDLVQLRMIERYGTINRDLDQLLLLSAESDDVNEQLIALEHMVERLEQFVALPQFSHCACSVIESPVKEYGYKFLNLVDTCLDQLPLDVLNLVPPLLFDQAPEVRLKSEQIIFKYFETLPEPIKQCEAIQIWTIANNIICTSEEIHHEQDLVSELGSLPGQRGIMIDYRRTRKVKTRDEIEKTIDNFVKLSPTDLRKFFETEFSPLLGVILNIVNLSWDKLSSEQKEVVPIGDLLASKENTLAELAESLILTNYEEFARLAEKYPFIQELKYLQETFNITLEPDESSISQFFESIPIDDWMQISPDVLKRLLTSPLLPSLNADVRIEKILENYDKLTQEQKDVFVTSQIYPKIKRGIHDYIVHERYNFEHISDTALVDLLSVPGYVQYEVLPGLLIRFERLSEETKLVIDELVNNPPDWWVGGSIGQITRSTRSEFEIGLIEHVKTIPIKLSQHHDKRVVGALLAEMAQVYCDVDIGLQEMYEPLLRELSKDSEVVRYAEAWMDNALELFCFYEKEYWSKMKTHLRNLAKSGEGEKEPTMEEVKR